MFCFIASGVSAGAGQSRRVFPCVLKANVAGTRIHGKRGGGLSRVAIRNKLVYFIRLRNKPLRTSKKPLPRRYGKGFFENQLSVLFFSFIRFKYSVGVSPITFLK